MNKCAWWMVALLAAASVLGGCANDCDRIAGYRNCSSVACGQCVTNNCSAYFSAFASPMCAADRQCIANCPGAGADFCNRGSNDICGCADNCLRTQACRDAYNNALGCAVHDCQNQCQ